MCYRLLERLHICYVVSVGRNSPWFLLAITCCILLRFYSSVTFPTERSKLFSYLHKYLNFLLFATLVIYCGHLSEHLFKLLRYFWTHFVTLVASKCIGHFRYHLF